MTILKFMNRADFPYVLDQNSIVLRRASFYRDKFESSHDEWIGDPQEGISRLSLPYAYSTGPEDPVNEVVKRMGISNAGTDMTFRNNSSQKTFDDAFLFCAARAEFSEMRDFMYVQTERNPTPYDGCLKIVDENGFLDRLATGVFQTMDGHVIEGSCSYSPFLGVTYQDGDGNPNERSHSPLIKRSIFKEQRETRVLFFPNPSEEPFISYDSIKLVAAGLGREFAILDPTYQETI